jgi:hypothetical protein
MLGRFFSWIISYFFILKVKHYLNAYVFKTSKVIKHAK